MDNAHPNHMQKTKNDQMLNLIIGYAPGKR